MRLSVLSLMKFIRTLLLLVIAATSTSGCYILQATKGQLSLMTHREPIAKVIANPATTPQLKSRLEYVQAAREFASHELRLPDNKSYRSYVDLKRKYVVWNVFAAPEFSVSPMQWCFPVAGCVVYRGYFKEEAAHAYADKLRSKGLDVAVSGAPAYSTLGHFNDPVLSSMMRWSDAQMASTLFHELAHQVVYVKGDSAFNEAFATVVADEGIKRWVKRNAREEDWYAWQLQEQRGNVISDLLLHAREQLYELYATRRPVEEMREEKQRILDGLKAEYATLKTAWNGYAGYDGWFNRPLNNADFIAVATYQKCVPAFEQLLHDEGDDLPRFYSAVKTLTHQDSVKRHSFCNK